VHHRGRLLSRIYLLVLYRPFLRRRGAQGLSKLRSWIGQSLQRQIRRASGCLYVRIWKRLVPQPPTLEREGERKKRMKIYVASSWRNTYQQEVVRRLRELHHTVYDFRGAGTGWGEEGGEGGFSWSAVDPEWQTWPDDVERYREGLNHPLAIEGYNRDMNALRACDACIMVMPCGPSASMEMGWAVGAGKLVAVYMPAIREPDLMVKMADLVTTKWDVIEVWLNVD